MEWMGDGNRVEGMERMPYLRGYLFVYFWLSQQMFVSRFYLSLYTLYKYKSMYIKIYNVLYISYTVFAAF